MKKANLLITLGCAVLVVLSGCTKSGSSDSSDSSGGGGSSSGGGGGSGPDVEGSSGGKCGVVLDGEYHEPVDLQDGAPIQVVDILSNNLIVAAPYGSLNDKFIVKIQGVGSSRTEYKNRASMERIASLTSGGALFFKATEDCNTTIQGSPGTIGSIVTTSGVNVAEDLIKLDLVTVETDICNGNLLVPCYSKLEDEKDPLTLGEAASGFLWKPASDKDGNLVVLAEPCDADIYVNGEKLFDGGPGNGRCINARGNKPGCAYGAQPVVQILDRVTGLPYTIRGEDKIIIPNGCARFEIPFE